MSIHQLAGMFVWLSVCLLDWLSIHHIPPPSTHRGLTSRILQGLKSEPGDKQEKYKLREPLGGEDEDEHSG